MKRDTKNSSGKIIGYTEIFDNQVIVKTYDKPILTINNQMDIQKIKDKDISDSFLLHLYDDYLLNIGEIASLYGVCYSNINKKLKKLPIKTSKCQGRRNRSYGKRQNEITKNKISVEMKKAYDRGCFKDRDYSKDSNYRRKISEGMKRYAKEHPENPEPHRKNWANGVYANVDFHRGIGGYFFSLKNNQDIYFRSLLELYFMLELERDDTVNSYQYEPLHIRCDNDSTYTPDILVNGCIIELKSYKFIHSSQTILNRVLYKKEQCKKYCSQHNLSYRMIYDKDIGFDSKRFKKELKNHPDLISKYNIRFNQPERIVNK